MRERETFHTFINKNRYTFDIKWDGYTWIARAFYNNNWTFCDLVSDVNSAEKAALKLVSSIEKKYK